VYLVLDVVHFDSQTLPKKFEQKIELSDDLDRVFLRSDPSNIHIKKESLLDERKLQKIADSLHCQLVSLLMTCHLFLY
jgi:inositol-1,3,4-trisphosphate 5/6-kinase/inositol-tetrakisphosphate 1-kinase